MTDMSLNRAEAYMLETIARTRKRNGDAAEFTIVRRDGLTFARFDSDSAAVEWKLKHSYLFENAR